MSSTSATRSEGAIGDGITAEWCSEHFDHLAPKLGRHFWETLDYMRAHCPVAHSDQYGGFWVATRYDDVLRVTQDWQTFSSAEGVAVPMALSEPPLPPDEYDPPLHRVFKRLINAYLTPAMVARYEEPTRQLVSRLIDDFIEAGQCEFMSAFAQQLPRLSFFEFVLHAPADDVARLNAWTKILTSGAPGGPGYQEAQDNLIGWINGFVDRRLTEAPRGDIVEAVVHAVIEGRPITRSEIVGTIQLLMFGGFETTGSALGSVIIRLARDPGILALLRRDPGLIPEAIDEFLRIEAPVTCMARTVTREVELGGRQLRKGDKVLFSLASANRDEEEFPDAATFDLGRDSNRHLAFGAGPHRCAGSNLARLNLTVALEELTSRLRDIRLQDGAEPIEYNSAFNRAPAAVPIAFTPGAKLSA